MPSRRPEADMLHMQHAQLAGLFMEKAHQPQIQFPAVESPEHQRQP